MHHFVKLHENFLNYTNIWEKDVNDSLYEPPLKLCQLFQWTNIEFNLQEHFLKLNEHLKYGEYI